MAPWVPLYPPTPLSLAAPHLCVLPPDVVVSEGWQAHCDDGHAGSLAGFVEGGPRDAASLFSDAPAGADGAVHRRGRR